MRYSKVLRIVVLLFDNSCNQQIHLIFERNLNLSGSQLTRRGCGAPGYARFQVVRKGLSYIVEFWKLIVISLQRCDVHVRSVHVPPTWCLFTSQIAVHTIWKHKYVKQWWYMWYGRAGGFISEAPLVRAVWGTWPHHTIPHHTTPHHTTPHHTTPHHTTPHHTTTNQPRNSPPDNGLCGFSRFSMDWFMFCNVFLDVFGIC